MNAKHPMGDQGGGAIRDLERRNFDLAVTVKCPKCPAAVGQACQSPLVTSPGRIWFHSDRLREARRAARKRPKPTNESR